jgi:hypothetical protein
MPSQIYDKHDLARVEGFFEIPETQKKRVAFSCLSVYFGYKRLQSAMPGLLGFIKRS